MSGLRCVVGEELYDLTQGSKLGFGGLGEYEKAFAGVVDLTEVAAGSREANGGRDCREGEEDLRDDLGR